MGVLMQTSGDEGGDAEAVEAIFDKGAMPQPGRPDQDEVSDEEGGLAEDRPLYVDIPESARQPKRRFHDEPSREIVKDIRDHVAEHGESHTWSGHTHTRPEDGARVKYIARFELPEKYQRKKQFLVCPICRPNSRNFGRRDGYIAWFPDEWLIRLIGPDCFAEIDKQGHADAVEELEKREARERDSVFLVSQRDQHRLALKVLTAARRVANALDAFGADLRRRLYVTLNVNLWQHVRTGELRVSREIADLRTPGKTLYLEQRFGSLSGHKLLDPNIKKLEPKFAPHVDFLEEILFITDDAWSEKIGQLGGQEVRQTAKKLGATLDAARDFRVEVTDLRAFLAPENLGTLRSWGSSNTEGSPIGVFARRDGATLRVGSSETRNMLVPIPLDLDLEIPSVAGLTAKRP